MSKKDKIIEEIRKIYDPELPVNIYELGLIYDIQVENENSAKIKMTLTTPNCPVAESLPKEVKEGAMQVEGIEEVDLEFYDDGIDMLAKLSTEINSTVENIGARRLHSIIEKVLDEISFTASDKAGQKIKIDKDYVVKNLGDLVKDTDLSKFIL